MTYSVCTAKSDSDKTTISYYVTDGKGSILFGLCTKGEAEKMVKYLNNLEFGSVLDKALEELNTIQLHNKISAEDAIEKMKTAVTALCDTHSYSMK